MAWGNVKNVEKIRNGKTQQQDEREVSKKDRHNERTSARKGKEWTRKQF